VKSVELENLRALCEELNLSESSRAKVEETVSTFADFEKSRVNLRTYPQRRKELANLKTQVIKLRTAINSISWQNMRELMFLIGETNYPGDSLIFQKNALRPMHHFNVSTCQLLDSLVEVADLGLTQIGVKGSKGGRLNVLVYQAIFLSNMACVVCVKDQIQPNGGKFRELCVAIFNAAGVHASPEGAIDAFMEKHGDEIKMRMKEYVSS
jgi:hypothetical protein